MKSMSRHAILTSLSNLVLGVVSALYGLLILRFFANEPLKSDAFFLAYTVFNVVAMFSVTLRISIVPMLGAEGDGRRDATGRYGELAIIVLGCFFVIALLVAALAMPLGRLLGYGLAPEGRRLTGLILLAFAPVIFFQGAAQFLSAALGARGFLDYVSGALAATSLAGVGVFVLTKGAGIHSVVLGLLAANGLLAGSTWLRARAAGMKIDREDRRRVSAASIRDTLGHVARCSSVYIAFYLAYTISQSLTTTFPAGIPTAFAYAYSITFLAVAATAGSLGITLTIRYRDYAAGPLSEFRAYVLEHGAMAGLIGAGAMGLLAVLAWPIGTFIFTILPAGGGSASLSDRAGVFALSIGSLAIGGWGLSVFGVLAPATIAAKRNRHFVTFTLLAMALHFVASVILKRYFGLGGVGVAFSITALGFAVFQILYLQRLFGKEFADALARRLIASAAAGFVSAAPAILALHVILPYTGWWAAVPISVTIFGAAFLVGTFFYERATWRTLLSHLPPAEKFGVR